MRRLYVGLLALEVLAGGFAFADYNPYYDTAMADVLLRVVDDEGRPVGGARVTAAFYINDTKTTGLTKETSEDGCIVAKYPCNGELKVWTRKDGYYDANFTTKSFITLTKAEASRTHKWSDGTVDIPVVLKKKRRPIELMRQDRQYWPFPATNTVVSLDLETLRWCPPYGEGRHADMNVLYEAEEHPEKGWHVSYWRRLTLSLPKVVDGVYCVKMDRGSQFPYVPVADTNAVFEKGLVFEVERKNDRMVKKALPAEGEYFIFRTRTATNEVGEVVRANYGRIGENLNLAIGLSIKAWFNPTPNDTNLEDARAW